MFRKASLLKYLAAIVYLKVQLKKFRYIMRNEGNWLLFILIILQYSKHNEIHIHHLT